MEARRIALRVIRLILTLSLVSNPKKPRFCLVSLVNVLATCMEDGVNGLLITRELLILILIVRREIEISHVVYSQRLSW